MEVPTNTAVPAGWLRKGGLAKVERYTTADLEDRAGQLVAAEDLLVACERQLLGELIEQVRPAGSPLREVARNLAGADALQSLATVAAERGWVPQKADVRTAYDPSFAEYANSVLGPYEPVANPQRPE